MRLETVNNLKMAKAPGINALQERLALADELIEWDWLLPALRQRGPHATTSAWRKSGASFRISM
jgi:hypothetical protein